jgi:polyribonucleotide nucleotidyltransferase
VNVPVSAVGSIIGRAGSVIKGLIETTGAQIKIQQKDDMRYVEKLENAYARAPPSLISSINCMHFL